MSHYETLGVPRDADAATIKRAFRQKARDHHPDHGGDHDEMQAVNKAYETLSDPERRARYDATGEDAPVMPLEARARATLAQMFNEAADKLDKGSDDDLNYTSLPAAIDLELQKIRKHNEQALKHLRRRIHQRCQALGRLKFKGTGPNVAAAALSDAIAHLERESAKVEEMQQMISEVLRQLGEYEYTVDRLPEGTRIWHTDLGAALQDMLARNR